MKNKKEILDKINEIISEIEGISIMTYDIETRDSANYALSLLNELKSLL